MSHGRKALLATVGSATLFLMVSGAVADSAALYLPPDEATSAQNQVKLSADRLFGFAPMTVNLSGMLEEKDGNLVPMNGGQQIRVIVESPFLRVMSSNNSSSVLSGLHFESTDAGPVVPSAFHRALEIRRPGTYLFRVQVIAPNGEVVNSNEVSVRAL